MHDPFHKLRAEIAVAAFSRCGLAVIMPPQEEDFMASDEDWEDGRLAGHVEGKAEALLIVLESRGIAVSDAAREQILGQRDVEQLNRWMKRSTSATTLAQVLDESR